MTDEREPKPMRALIYPLPGDPPLMMTEPTDEELYGATQWRSYIERAQPEPTPIRDAIDRYLSGQWKRRDGTGVQRGKPDTRITQELDPWARRSPPAVDV